MHTASNEYIEKSSAPTRIYTLRVTQYRKDSDGAYVQKARYNGGDKIYSLKIVLGQTTGGYELGGTVCAQLLISFERTVNAKVRDLFNVEVAFGMITERTEWLSLGWFYADTVERGAYNTNVTAYDKMLQLEKVYISKLEYPTSTLNVLKEISAKADIKLSSALTLINDTNIRAAPIINADNQEYYTMRDVLGFTAAINGGKMYVDIDNKLNICAVNNDGYYFAANEVITQALQDAQVRVTSIKRNANRKNTALSTDYDAGKIYYLNPIPYVDENTLNKNLSDYLVGLEFESVVLKKQGTGLYELGDLVQYTDLDGDEHTMFINGIVYDFSNGYFSETLYSLAASDSTRDYAGKNTDTATPEIEEEEMIIYNGVYCGVIKSTGAPDPAKYIKSKKITFSSDSTYLRAQQIAAALAELTGWELHATEYYGDTISVSVGANGVGFRISPDSNYVFLTSAAANWNGIEGADFQVLPFTSSDNTVCTVSVCKGQNITAWGFSVDNSRELTFIHYNGKNGGAATVFAEYNNAVYMVSSGDDTNYTIYPPYSYSDASFAASELHELSDLRHETVIHELYVFGSINSATSLTSGQAIQVGGGKFFVIHNTQYGTQYGSNAYPILALKVGD